MWHFCAGFHVVREGGWRHLVFFCVGVFVERVSEEKGEGRRIGRGEEEERRR